MSGYQVYIIPFKFITMKYLLDDYNIPCSNIYSAPNTVTGIGVEYTLVNKIIKVS